MGKHDCKADDDSEGAEKVYERGAIDKLRRQFNHRLLSDDHEDA